MSQQTQQGVAGRPVTGRPTTSPCPQCGLPMGAEIALLVGQHLTCPPLDAAAERRTAAVRSLLDLTFGEMTGRQLRDVGLRRHA